MLNIEGGHKSSYSRKIKVIVLRSGKNNVVQKGLTLAFKKYHDKFDVEYISIGK